MKSCKSARSYILCVIALVLFSSVNFGQCPGVTAVLTSNPTTCGVNGTIRISFPAIAATNQWGIYWEGNSQLSPITTAHSINISVSPGNHWFYIYQFTSGWATVCSTPISVPVKFQVGPALPAGFSITSATTSNCSSSDGSITLHNAPLGVQFSIIDKNNTVVAGPTTITASSQLIATGLPSNIYRVRYGSCNYLDRAVMVERPAACYGTCVATGENLVVNGEFDAGNTGYFSNYPFYSPFSTFCAQYGGHSIGSNASATSNSIGSCGDYWSAIDRNGNNGKFLLVDPSAATGANDSMWRQIIPVCQNTNYIFQSWVKNVFYQDGDAAYLENGAEDPIMSLNINGVDLYNTGSIPRQAKRDSAEWFPVFVTWNSGLNSFANISIANKITGTQGNDIALDGIFFGKCAPSISIASNPGVGQCITGAVDFVVTSSEPNFQWQESNDAGANWINIGSNVNSYTDNLPVDTRKYRVYAASSVPGLISASCRTVSSTYTIGFNGTCYVILPLKFTSFLAAQRESTIDLSWTISANDNDGKFAIERKTVASNSFVQIGELAAFKNDSGTLLYRFIDTSPLHEPAQYRIKYISANGKITYSKTIQVVGKKDSAFSIQVRPSPFTEKLSVSVYSNQASEIHVRLLNQNGAIVKTINRFVSAGNTEISIPFLSNLPGGVYVLQVQCAKSIAVEKIIKL